MNHETKVILFVVMMALSAGPMAVDDEVSPTPAGESARPSAPPAGKGASSAKDTSFVARCDGTTQRYVLVLPETFAESETHDVLIALHGHGSDRWQFIKDARDECRAARDTAMKHGMIFISPDYRASTSWMGPKAEADLVQIIEELKQQYKVRKVFLCGGSMGGTACLTFAALHPDLVDGVASMNGTANLVEYENFQDAIQASFGGTKEMVPEEYKKRSAEYFPERFTMPVGISAGGKDSSVPSASVVRLAETLKTAGRHVLLLFREDGGHETNYADGTAILEFVIEKAGQVSPTARPGDLRSGEPRTIDLGGGVTLVLVWIPPGEFLMGSPESEAGRDGDEGPQRRVVFAQGFWLGKYEVTQTQWRAVMNTSPSFFTGDRLPVEQVSWEDCQEFVKKLSERTKRIFRLPSEAEWEYACRANTTTPFHFGETLSTDQANYDGNFIYAGGKKGIYREKTVETGSFESNSWGLHDMHGNVREWCEDYPHDTYAGAPLDGSAWLHNPGKNERILRGGSWASEPKGCRSANRGSLPPNTVQSHYGFRVLRMP